MLSVIVVAAGSGARLGAADPKAFVDLGGRPMLAVALDAVFESAPDTIVVVVPASHLAAAEAIAGAEPGIPVVVVPGGADRTASVRAGLAALGAPNDGDVVLVHDAARPLTPPDQFRRVAAAVAEHGCGVIPALPVVDTLKRVHGARVLGTPDRDELVAAQTPQGFPRELLEAACVASTDPHTDDAGLVQAAGGEVRTVAGDPRAFKITVPDDLDRARRLVERGELRTGVGVDAHAFDPSVPLMLGGVSWPQAPAGLAGHSDGDAACHAIVDALLAAASLGDIGSVFGTDDPRRAGASGAEFIREAVALVADAGWRVVSVAVEIVANEPRIGPRRAEIEGVLGGLVGAPVSVAGTTSDGLGLTGRGEGVAAVATALLAR